MESGKKTERVSTVCGDTAGFNSIRASAGAPRWPLTQDTELNTQKSSSMELSCSVTPRKCTLIWNLIQCSLKTIRIQLHRVRRKWYGHGMV